MKEEQKAPKYHIYDGKTNSIAIIFTLPGSVFDYTPLTKLLMGGFIFSDRQMVLTISNTIIKHKNAKRSLQNNKPMQNKHIIIHSGV